jgi:hypothetical protein
VTAVQARSLGIKGSILARLTQRGTWDLVNSRFARLKCNRARTAFQQEHKANKTCRHFYRQSPFLQ